MKTILFYSPFNNRSRDTETLMLAFKSQGHRVISLSQAKGDHIHTFLQSKGIEVFSYVLLDRGFIYYLKHIFFFVKFCRSNHIDIVYAHLESANFVAAIAQYFVRAKVYICRHHIDEALLQGFDKSLFYRLTYKLAKRIIVVSNRAVNFMIVHERIPRHKIVQINLAYDFDLYPKPDSETVRKIKSQNPAGLLLLSVGRLTKFKRFNLSIDLLKKLVDMGIDAKLIILGVGEELYNLKQQAIVYNISERLTMPGYVNNVIDFLAASDYLVHPSVLESSCVVVKEAGLVRSRVIVCGGVGDFDDYIVHGNNGFIANSNNFVNDTVKYIQAQRNEKSFEQIGINLQNDIYRRFDVKQIINQYNSLNSCED